MGYEFLNIDKQLFNIPQYQLACSDITIIEFLGYSMLSFLLMSLVVSTIMTTISKILKDVKFTIVIGVLIVSLCNILEFQYYIRFWHLVAEKVSDFSPEVLHFLKYEKAFNPFALVNSSYYFEKIRYGEFCGHFIPIYVFPLVSCIIVMILLCLIILGSKNK